MVGACKGISDLLQFKFEESFFNGVDNKFWDASISHANKWKEGYIKSAKRKWYYLWIYKPKYEEAFPYSSTLLVGFTDGWHTIQWFMIKFIFLSVLAVWWHNPEFHSYDLIGMCSLYGGFWMTHESKLLRI